MNLVNIDHHKCQRDGYCVKACPSELLFLDEDGFPVYDRSPGKRCIFCGHCVAVCPHDAIAHRKVPQAKSEVIDPTLGVAPEALANLMKTRRSIRSFKSKIVPEELIRKAIDLTRWAPTAVNRQQVQWLIIRDPAAIKKIRGLIIDFLREANGPGAPYATFIESCEKGRDPILRGAPHLAIAHSRVDWPWGPIDSTIALTHFDLAANAYGLGTCWAGLLMMAYENCPALAKALALPDGQKICGAMMFGYPAFSYRRIPVRAEAKIEMR